MQSLLDYCPKWIPTEDILLGTLIKEAPWNLGWPEPEKVSILQEYPAPANDFWVTTATHTHTQTPTTKLNGPNQITALPSREQSSVPVSSLWVFNGLIPNTFPLPL